MISWDDFAASLLRAADYHKVDEYHHDRVSKMAVEIGRRMGLDEESLRLLKFAAALHDVGRVGVDHDIMTQRGKLTDAERGAIQTHPLIGYQLVKGILPEEICQGILHHHENWDGTGYPSGLRGEDIPLFARIIAVCDRWDALCHNRPYRSALSFEIALDFMNLDSRYFDPQVYAHFLDIVREAREGK